jgi:phenylacetate-CoA ligase
LNVDWLSRLPAPARRSLYFGLQRAVGSKVGLACQEMQAWERLTPAALEEQVEQALSSTLEEAVVHSPYYRELELRRRPGERAAAFLARFPILTRAKIREHFKEMVVDALREEITSPGSVARKRYDWLVVRTGGTVGTPTTVVHDAWGRDWGRATRLLSARLCGLPLGTPYFYLWGSETDLLQTEASLTQRVQQALLGGVPMNAFRSFEADVQQHYEIMRAHPGIDHMMAYVDAAVILALHIRSRGLPPPRLRSVMACAGTVTTEWRQILQETFQAEVFDKYGSRECCDMACECSAHQGLHVYSPNVYVEIVDASDAPCAPGQTGRLLVTMLNNRQFPMIRYEIGDLAAWTPPGRCSCGLAWPRLQSLQGRQDDMLMTEDGTLITSVFIRHFVGVSHNWQIIREWQLEQTGRRRFIFRYVPAIRSGLHANLEAIRASFRRALGAGIELDMVEVTEIPRSPSGKIRWIINNVPRQ